ncbi:hypothetical protein [Polyangium jinanense]|uniref:Uncharacterized protein n=1 Tax=Polyangium jinanense TaxID=2829994 RepID=A0A9X4AZM8_9BACT|nr:hypothetical protein [Polyangium jinanense]MDC3961779.1 hypothetical protein [Polyangium jinanense]MDC3988327.1 hypothetical protein [Polyangium jinanense]
MAFNAYLGLAIVAVAIVMGCESEPEKGVTSGAGGADSCATLPVAEEGELCVASSAFGGIYIEQVEKPDGYSIIGFAEPDSCSYFLEVENVLEENGTPVSFLKVELLGELPGTCKISSGPDLPPVPHDGSCVAVVRTRRFSAAGKEDLIADSGEVVVTQSDASTLEAHVEATIDGRAVSLDLAAPHCQVMCTCVANLAGCPCF